MNFNELIENEINKRVEEKVNAFKKEYEKQLQFIVRRKLQEITSEISNKINEIKLDNLIDETVVINEFFYGNKDNKNQKSPKCNFPTCKNYGDGSIDSMCEKCDNRIIKEKQEKQEKKNLEEYKNNIKDNKEDNKKIVDIYVNTLNDQKKIDNKELKNLINKLLGVLDM